MPSIHDVARLAGVSKSTVSRVLNRAANVDPALRDLVVKAIEELNYEPALNRRHRKAKSSPEIRTGNLLLMYSWQHPEGLQDGERAPLIENLLRGAGAAAHEIGFNLLIAEFGNGQPLTDQLDRDRVDGVLLVGRPHGLEEQIRERLGSLPAVLMMREYGLKPQNASRVFYDNAAIGPIAARHLLAAGHTRTAFLNSLPKHGAFGEREVTFVQAMQQARGQALALSSDSVALGLEVAADRLVDKMKRAQRFPEGICTANDAMLPELYRALEANGIRPQTDVAIVSCDNDPNVIRTVTPRPATIDIRTDLVGHLAVYQLHWALNHPHLSGDVTVTVPPKLVEP